MRSHYYYYDHRRLWTVAWVVTLTTVTTLPSVVSDVPDYGFPRCYASFDDYDTAFVDDRAHHETRPLTGAQRFPYEGGDAADCANATLVRAPLLALGPHWSPVGVTRYARKDGDACRNCLPDVFGNGTLLVASHGSWNRDPYIGYRVHAYDVDLDTTPYTVNSQTTLLPPLRHADTGRMLRPVDVKTSPVDDALLLTADHDDSSTDDAGGLYRVRGAASVVPGNDADDPEDVPFATEFNALGENPAGVVLERLATIPCARQLALSPTDPTLVYVSVYGGFCGAGRLGGLFVEGNDDTIWVLQLATDDSRVVQGPVRLVDKLNNPQGIDTVLLPGDTTPTLYIATGGTTGLRHGRSVLEFKDVDRYAYEALGLTDTTDLEYPLHGTRCDDVITTLVEDFSRRQLQHSWRSLRVHPSGAFLVVSVGADCNWSERCTDCADKNDLQTTLVRIGLDAATRGEVSIAARGIRNAIGFHFDVDEDSNVDRMIFTSFGSDMASGIPDASSADNTPDCTVEVLEFDHDDDIIVVVRKSWTTVLRYRVERAIEYAQEALHDLFRQQRRRR